MTILVLEHVILIGMILRNLTIGIIYKEVGHKTFLWIIAITTTNSTHMQDFALK